jgi:hypothetical protein
MRGEALDFLYVDTNRIARLVAQMDEAGVVKEVVRELSYGAEAKGGIKYFFGELSAAIKGDRKNSRTYDPQWRLPVEFVKLTESAEDHTSILSASRGDIVKLIGQLSLIDYRFMSEMLKVPSISDGYSSAVGAASAVHPSPDALVKTYDSVPNLLVAMISAGPIKTWSTLNNVCTTASTGDLILKCGPSIAGEWTLIGILDELPLTLRNAKPSPEPTVEAEIASQVRAHLGSPLDHHAITPLTIHRRVQWRR